ncbi:MAG: PIN domain nuclease [Deltaproteobacteria bacterium]|nr:PIN domain nuclease [Deltaproteobacteria bacterium]
MLDAGALIAIDRGDRRMLALLEAAREARAPLTTTAPVVAQAWHDGRVQARLAAFLKQPEVSIAPFDAMEARAVGTLATLSRHDDVVDTHVVLLARAHRQTIVTSDPDDVQKVDPKIRVVRI